MQTIYEHIQSNPEYFLWVFAIVNVLWGLFVYFNKQRHERELKYLDQELRFQADRRLKIFDLKATQYSQYVTDLDAFGKKNQVEIPAKMQPLFDGFTRAYLSAKDTNDIDKEREALTWFGSEVSKLIHEGMQDLMKLKYESNRLKLIATDEMLHTFDKIESLNQQISDCTSVYMNNFVEIAMTPNDNRAQEFQENAMTLATEIQEQSKLLLEQMRQEINGI